MPGRAKELDNRHDGDRRACPVCNPKPGRISEARLWEWAMRQTVLPVVPLRPVPSGHAVA